MSEVTASPEATFLDALRAGQLHVQACRCCERTFFFPRTHCTHCNASDYMWQPMRSGATLYSYSEIPGTAQTAARNVILVDMDEGFRMMSTVPDAALGELRIGMRLQARVDAGAVRVVFDREAA